MIANARKAVVALVAAIWRLLDLLAGALGRTA